MGHQPGGIKRSASVRNSPIRSFTHCRSESEQPGTSSPVRSLCASQPSGSCMSRASYGHRDRSASLQSHSAPDLDPSPETNRPAQKREL